MFPGLIANQRQKWEKMEDGSGIPNIVEIIFGLSTLQGPNMEFLNITSGAVTLLASIIGPYHVLMTKVNWNDFQLFTQRILAKNSYIHHLA